MDVYYEIMSNYFQLISYCKKSFFFKLIQEIIGSRFVMGFFFVTRMKDMTGTSIKNISRHFREYIHLFL